MMSRHSYKRKKYMEQKVNSHIQKDHKDDGKSLGEETTSFKKSRKRKRPAHKAKVKDHSKVNASRHERCKKRLKKDCVMDANKEQADNERGIIAENERCGSSLLNTSVALNITSPFKTEKECLERDCQRMLEENDKIDCSVRIKKQNIAAEENLDALHGSNYTFQSAANQNLISELCSICVLMGKSEIATFVCLNCNDLLCNLCADKHKFSRYTIHHKVENISPNVLEAVTQSNARCNNRNTCLDHPQELLTIFCKHCVCLTCKLCSGLKHFGHPCVNSEDAVLIRKKDLMLLQNHVKEKVSDLNVSLDDNDKFLKELKLKETEEINTIQQFVLKFVHKVMDDESTVIEKIKSECSRLKESGVQANKEIRMNVQCLKEMLSSTDNLSTICINEQEYISVDSLMFKSIQHLLNANENPDAIRFADVPHIQQAERLKELQSESLFVMHKSRQIPGPLPTRKMFAGTCTSLKCVNDHPFWVGEIDFRTKGSAKISGNIQQNESITQTFNHSDANFQRDTETTKYGSSISILNGDMAESMTTSSPVAYNFSDSQTETIGVDSQMLSCYGDCIAKQTLSGILEGKKSKREDKKNNKKSKKKEKQNESKRPLQQTNKIVPKTTHNYKSLPGSSFCLSNNSLPSSTRHSSLNGFTVSGADSTSNIPQNLEENTTRKNLTSFCPPSFNNKAKLTPAFRVYLQTPTDEVEPKISGITCIKKNRFAISDYDNNKIKIFYTLGVLCNEWNAERPEYISYVIGHLVYSSKNNVVVMNKNLNAKNKSLSSWTVPIKTPNGEVVPHPIAGFNNCMYVGNGDHVLEIVFFKHSRSWGVARQIQLHTETGEVIKRVQNLCEASSHRTIVSNWDDKSVVFLDEDGNAFGKYLNQTGQPKLVK